MKKKFNINIELIVLEHVDGSIVGNLDDIDVDLMAGAGQRVH